MDQKEPEVLRWYFHFMKCKCGIALFQWSASKW